MNPILVSPQEIRGIVSMAEAVEAVRLGFRRIVVPASALEQCDRGSDVEILGVKTVDEAWEVLRAMRREN